MTIPKINVRKFEERGLGEYVDGRQTTLVEVEIGS